MGEERSIGRSMATASQLVHIILLQFLKGGGLLNHKKAVSRRSVMHE